MARAEDLDPEDGTDDSDALSWAGDDARGQAPPSRAPRVDDVPVAAEAAEASATQSDPVRLVGTGIFAGIFLAYTVGWILSVQSTGYAGLDLFGEIMWQFGEFLAIISAALWFATTLHLTRERRTAVRLGWLAVGVAVLVPWPILWGWLW